MASRRKHGMRAFAGDSLRLRVEMRGIEPAIWRSLTMPAELTLDCLHEALQIAFGWTNSHLHQFDVGSVTFGVADPMEEILVVDECAAPLGALAVSGQSFIYRYDLGDCWEHEIRLEAVVELAEAANAIECLDGARSAPPEDSGGTSGYEELLQVLANPKHEEYQEVRSWVGRKFDPERFDRAAINKKLAALGKRAKRALQLARLVAAAP
jgi:hypothetical protein